VSRAIAPGDEACRHPASRGSVGAWARGARRTAAVLGAIGLGLTLGCAGYSTSRLVAEPGIASVAVLEFDNQTYRRDIEMRLTQTLAQEVRARTPWRIESPARADALLSGTIRQADTQVLAQDKDRNSLEQRYRWVVDCKLVERSTGRVLRDWSVTRRQEWSEGQFGESLDTSATDDIARAVALAIVEGLEKPIGNPDAVPPPRTVHYRLPGASK